MIEVEQLSKTFGTVRAVRDLSFTVERGSVVGFLGPNGAGKSTTLRMVAGFLGATSGRVTIDGLDIELDRQEALHRIGYQPETSPLYPEMRVGEYLRFRGELKGVSGKSRQSEAERVAEWAQVAGMLDTPIGHLSKGYRQRVGLADALLNRPPVLILDEPAAGLDPNQIREMRLLIRALGEEHTVLLSTHILSEVEAACERAIVIDRGRLVAHGSIEELTETHKLNNAVRTEIVVRGARKDVERIAQVGEAKLVWQGAVEEGAHRLQITFAPTSEGDDAKAGKEPGPIEDLVKRLVEADLGVRAVKELGPSLEDVFSRLTHSVSGSKDSTP